MLHEKRDSLNAYIVFKNEEDAKKSLSLNGSLFLERHIRVDHSEKKAEKKRDAKRCIFVGNLSFDISDESLWGCFGDAGEIEYVRVIRDHKLNVGNYKLFNYQEKDLDMSNLRRDLQSYWL